MTMGALFAYSKQDNIKHYIGWNKAFPKNDKRFKVLLLPFKQLCDDKRDVGDVVKDRLEQLSKDDTLDIGVHYADIPISNSFNDDSANYYMEYHRADFVIYGQYQDKNCTGKGKDEYCMNFQTSFQSIERSQKKYGLNIEATTLVGLYDDFLKSNWTTSIELVAYYVASLYTYEQQDYQRCIIYTNKAIDTKSNYVYLYSNRGAAYYWLKNYDNAIADHNKAIQIDSNKAMLYLSRSSCYLAQREYSKTIADLDKAIQLAPKAAILYYKPCICLF